MRNDASAGGAAARVAEARGDGGRRAAAGWSPGSVGGIGAGSAGSSAPGT